MSSDFVYTFFLFFKSRLPIDRRFLIDLSREKIYNVKLYFVTSHSCTYLRARAYLITILHTYEVKFSMMAGIKSSFEINYDYQTFCV